MYPTDWPRCPKCDKPALDGHITCGSWECGESEERRKRDAERMAIDYAMHGLDDYGFR